MRAARLEIRILLHLWRTRRTSGLPWPSWRGMHGGWRMALLGVPSYSPMPLRRQILGVPLRPWRYIRRVRAVARTRAMGYSAFDYDEVA